LKGSTRAKLSKLLTSVKKEGVKHKVRVALVEKDKVINEVKDLLSRYKVIAILDISGVPSREYKEIKKALSKYGVVKVYKNTLIYRALKDLSIRGLEELEPYLVGVNAYFFTNLNAFEIANILDKLVTLRYAKPGDKATDDIYVPEGPTGIPPGPMMSVFGKLKIRTMVKEGVIWIAKETKVASAGDEISVELASLLRKLNVKPIAVKLNAKVVWDNGTILRSDQLRLDIESFRKDLITAFQLSKNLAVNIALPIPEIMPEVLSKAFTHAVTLASHIAYVTPDTAPFAFRIAVAKAQALALILSQKNPDLRLNVGIAVVTTTQQPTQQPAPATEAKKEEEEEKKEVSEEEIAEGISSLFG